MSQYAYKGQQLNISNGHHQQLAPLSNLPSLQYPQDSTGQGQQLPPINTYNGPQSSYHPVAQRTYSNGPHTPHTPHTPVSTAHSNGSQQNGPLPSLMSSQHHTGYAPIVPNYSLPQAHSSAGASTAPTNHSVPATNGTTLPQLSPAIYPATSRQLPLNSYSGQPQIAVQPPTQPNSDPRYHMAVVGSQGRRGVLPSAPGRTSLVGGSGLDGNARTPPAPVKNAEGKFPCQYCNKTYLHAKHLKRHNLRHTGERPYQCSLCSETFCRSDILKRHFSKCAVRRGNPSGATHLTHAQAHLRTNQGDQNTHTNGYQSAPSSATTEGPPPINGAWRNGLANTSGGSSRSSSLIRPGSSGSDDKKRLSGPNTVHPVNVGLDANGNHPIAAHPPTHLDRQYSNYSVPPDRLTSHSYQDNSQQPTYTSAPPSTYPLTSQHESHPPAMMYNQNHFNHYHGNQQGNVNGESWATYFQPGAQDAMMFSQ